MSRRRSITIRVVVVVLSLAVGAGIAWIDTQESWDDTGVTAGLLVLGAMLSALAGLPWTVAAVLVGGPLAEALAVEGSMAALFVIGFATAGAVVGRILARSFVPRAGR